MDPAKINHVSDTALWIAAYRAEETARPDAAFHDPLAGKLAGARGKAILESIPHGDAMAFFIIVRTVAIDRLILNAVARGIDTVINLGAGMDTRPYRLILPERLSWIEVDYPALIDQKAAALISEKPNCQLERIGSDLADQTARRNLFRELGARGGRVLVLTEGVIGYLTNEEAASLSRDLFAIANFQYWIQEYSQGKMRTNRQSKKISKLFETAPWQFTVEKPIEFFARDGWRIAEQLYILDEAERIGRRFPALFPWNLLLKMFPAVIKNLGNKTFGYGDVQARLRSAHYAEQFKCSVRKS